MRNGILNRNKTTLPNTGAMHNPEEFYEPGINHRIAIREMGGVEAFNDCVGSLSQAEESKHEEWESQTELKSLMRGHHIDCNSSGNLKIPGSSADRIAETLIYGKERKSAIDWKIGKVKRDLSDFPNQVKNGKNWKEKRYREKKKEIIGK